MVPAFYVSSERGKLVREGTYSRGLNNGERAAKLIKGQPQY